MNDAVNLNRFRKKKTRAENEKRAEQNRKKYGRTKAEKLRDKAERDALSHHLDEHRINKDD